MKDAAGSGPPQSRPTTASVQPAARHVAGDRPDTEASRREESVDIGPAKRAASGAVDAAVTAAGERAVGWWKPLEEQPNFSDLLDPDRVVQSTTSLGTVSHGRLVHSAQLPVDGQHYSVIERHRRRHTQYATDDLIELVVDSANAVAQQHPGSTLRVGNMSVEHGGDLRWSSSHNSGRDADLAFYCRRKSDREPVRAPDLLHFDANGQAIERPDLVFDTARNWDLVAAMLDHDGVGVQWLFVSRRLKALLLEYARQHHAGAGLIARARKVLHQPTDAPPHNDHFHLRITCPAHDRVEGCLDYGPRWKWVDWHKDALLARSVAIGRAFTCSTSPKTRLRALDLLSRIRSPYAPELALADALDESDAQVRKRALEVAADIPHWSGAAVGAALDFVAKDDVSVDEKSFAYRVLRLAVDPLAVDPLKRRVANTELSVDERVLAARSLAHFMRPELVPFLLDQIDTQPPPVAGQLADVLRRVTNRSESVQWTTASRHARTRGLAAWKEWWKTHKHMPRDGWLRQGFVAHGFDGTDVFTVDAVGQLIGLLTDTPDHIAYNANLILGRITDRWAPLEAWSNRHRQSYWSRWWKLNHQRLLSSRPPTGARLAAR